MNTKSVEFGILIQGCTYRDLRAVLPLSKDGDPCLACEDHVVESANEDGPEHYVSFGVLQHGAEVPVVGPNVEYWTNAIKSGVKGARAKFAILEVWR